MIDDNSKKLGRIFMIVLIVIGIIIMFILKLIPFIGGIIIFISLIYGIGSIINIILKSRK